MNDEDVRWLTAFNARAEGASGDPAQSPVRESQGQNQMPPPSAGRPSRNKGKEREKETPSPIFISEDTFEFVMGVFEKHAEDTVPMLHTVSDFPAYKIMESLRSAVEPISASGLFIR